MPPELPSELSTESGLRPPEDLISDTEIKPLDVENEGKVQETETEVVAEEEEVKAPEEPQLTPEEEEAIRKQIAIEMRKAELRARMEAASKARRAKKGFMTPERKKKLRLLLRKKAAEELKKEQEQKALQRQWIIEDRCGDPEDLEWASKDDLMDICEDYYQRIWECEGEKWDLEYEIRKRAYEIAELSSKVNDLRGKFQKPILKKVSKYENKFSLLQRKAAEFNYRNQLKMVKRPEFILKDLEDKKNHGDKKGEKPRMARCASCTYPLTIIDSIVCYECSSYFHIDCAQLVGFPYYELSSDPSRNTFHCATCKILPLPRRRSESDSDSETEGDSAMPSRQLDYQLEGDVDLAKNLNEVQGSVQDLSDLCKDMLREINELKSINLTLRCCIENLRHDNENRDCVIAELKYRLDVLERNRKSDKVNTEASEWSESREGGIERYLTPEPEENSKVEELSTSFSKAYIPDYRNESSQRQDEILQSILPEEKVDDKEDENEDATNKTSEDLQDSGAIKGTEDGIPEPETVTSEKEEPLYTEETFTFGVKKESKAEELSDVEQRRKDWDWRGTKAVEVKHLEDEESEEEESDSESSQVEEGGNHGWEILEEEIRSKTSSEPNKFDKSGDDFWSSKKDEENVEEGEETETEEESWKEKCEMRDKEHVWEKDLDVEQKISKEETESNYESEAEEAADQETPVQEETPEDGAEKKEGELLGEGEEGKLPEGVEGEITAEGAAVLEGEPRLDGDEEARLEGDGAPQPNTEDTPRLEVEQGVEGEQLGGQSSEGEVQPTEPQPPPPPVHTEEDLWHYLKETVTSVHPATVEEFVQNLIGTLQQVPEEYLKPVIEANIKRAASPCVLDGEQPVDQEGTPLVEEGQEAPPDGSVPTESSESGTTVAGEVSEVTTEVAGDAVASEVPPEMPEEPATTEEVTDGFSIVEATA